MSRKKKKPDSQVDPHGAIAIHLDNENIEVSESETMDIQKRPSHSWAGWARNESADTDTDTDSKKEEYPAISAIRKAVEDNTSNGLTRLYYGKYLSQNFKLPYAVVDKALRCIESTCRDNSLERFMKNNWLDGTESFVVYILNEHYKNA